ncbi:hypothetical protein K523DRAFT_255616 [Schizophyllum commune Tattone D]|nr:hypothetical protein K523DRAFT_255616 [Schizophyllum commune Tattone D]
MAIARAHASPRSSQLARVVGSAFPPPPPSLRSWKTTFAATLRVAGAALCAPGHWYGSATSS